MLQTVCTHCLAWMGIPIGFIVSGTSHVGEITSVFYNFIDFD